MQARWRPTPAGLSSRLARARADELTYAEVGAVAGPPPEGYAPLEQLTDLGPDPAALARVGRALLAWQLHREARMVLAADQPTVQVGATVVTAAPCGPLAVLAPCRVVAVVAEPDRLGFAYGSLPGHPLVGEEQFAVELSDGRVRLRIRSFSRPVGLAGRAPVLARAGQRLVNRRYAAAARRLAAGDA